MSTDSDPWELENDLRQCQKHLEKSIKEGVHHSVISKISNNCYAISNLLSKYDDRCFEK